jgi:hypothetical protein
MNTKAPDVTVTDPILSTNMRGPGGPQDAFPSTANPADAWWVQVPDGYIAYYPTKRNHVGAVANLRGSTIVRGGCDSWAIRKGATLHEALHDWRKEWLVVCPSLHQKYMDRRPMMKVVSVDPSWVTNDNPLGYNGAYRRFDKREGVGKFLAELATSAAKTQNCQGAIFWALGGWHKRGCMYRPDGHVLPSEVAENVGTLVAGLTARGMWAGSLMRPNKAAVAYDSAADLEIRLDGVNAQKVAHRYALEWRGMGIRPTYLDECGDSPDCFGIIRRVLVAGYDNPVFTEHGSMSTVSTAGLYIERGRAGESMDRQWWIDLARWVYPELPIICVCEGTYTPEMAVAEGYIPLIEDYLWAKEPDRWAKLGKGRPKRDEGETKATKGVLP